MICWCVVSEGVCVCVSFLFVLFYRVCRAMFNPGSVILGVHFGWQQKEFEVFVSVYVLYNTAVMLSLFAT